MKCKYCKREIPNKNFKTSSGKCIWCDDVLALQKRLKEKK